MPFSIAYPLVRGHRFSFASIELRIAGSPLPIVGIKSINWSNKLTPGIVRGTAPHKLGRTRGQHDATGDMEMYLLEWENLRVTLGAAGFGYGETMFDIIVSYAELPTSPVVTYALIGCRVTEDGFSNTEGTDPTSVKITLDVMDVISPGGGSIVAPIRA